MKLQTQLNFLALLAFCSLVCSCTTPSKLISQGKSAYRLGYYTVSHDFFTKAKLKKKTTSSQRIEIDGWESYVQYKLGNYQKSYKLFSDYNRIYEKNSNWFMLASLNSRLGKDNEAMRILWNLSETSDFNKYRIETAKSPDFKTLHSNPVFQRYLAGVRRIKIVPDYGFASWGLTGTPEDLFVTVKVDNKIVLVTETKIQKDSKTSVSFFGHEVIIDAPIGGVAEICLIDQDYSSGHDLIVKHKFKINQNEIGKVSHEIRDSQDYSGILEYHILETNDKPYSTGINLPKETEYDWSSLLPVVGAIGYTYFTDNKPNTYDKSFISKLISCSTQSGISYFIDNPFYAGIVEEAYVATKNKYGISVKNMASNTLQNYVIQELNNSGHKQIATIIEAGNFINCLR